MNHDKLKMLARKHLENCDLESDCLEYKTSEKQKDKIVKTLCAFANNLMNRPYCMMLFGVEEVSEDSGKGTPKRPIIGYYESQVEAIENKILSLIPFVTPKISVDITDDVLDGRHYIIVGMEKQHKGPFETTEKAEHDKSISLKHGRYVRIERDSRLATVQEEILLLKKFADYHFTELSSISGTIDDLNIDQMREFLKASSGKDNTFSLNKDEIVSHLSLSSEENPKMAKNFALLMFADRPEKFIPGAYIELIEKGKEGESIMRETDFKGPIWKQAKSVLYYLSQEKIRSYTLRFDNRMENRIVYNYPYPTLEELIVNAIIHKDYETDRTIQIYLYQDRITIVNYNRPLPPVTFHSLNANNEFPYRQYENPTLREMFKTLGLIESYGSGIGKAKKAMRENGSGSIHYQEFDESVNITSVEIPINQDFQKIQNGENQDIGAKDQDIDAQNQDIDDPISVISNSSFNHGTKQNMLKLQRGLQNVVFGRTEVIKALGCSSSVATEYIKRLYGLDLLESVSGRGKSKFRFK